MAKMQPYVYNRGQQIGQSFKEASGGLDRAFQNLIDKKKQEYDFVQKQANDIELIKKDLKWYNSDILTKDSDSILQDTASAIKENGKLDFQKLGEIKRRVGDLATAKRNSEQTLEVINDATKMMQANAANMIDPIGTYNKMVSTIKDKDKLFNPKSIYDTVMDIYKDGVDYVKVGQNKLQELNKRGTPISGQYEAPDGSIVEYKGTVPFGFKFDDATKKIVPSIIKDKNGNDINPIDTIAATIFDEDQKKGYIKQIVGSGIMFNDNPDDYIKQLVEGSINGNISFSTKESAAKNQLNKAKAIKAQIEIDPKTLEAEAKQQAFDNQIELQKLNLGRQRLGIAAQGLAIDQQEFSAKKEGDFFNKGANPANINEPIKYSDTGTSFYTNTKYKGKDIVGIGVSTGKGLVLIDQYGGKVFLDDGPKINSFYNNLEKKDQVGVNTIMATPYYKPVDKKVKVVGGNATKANKNVTDVGYFFKQPK